MRFIPAVFSHTGQIHEAFKVFVKDQIRLKFEAFEGEVSLICILVRALARMGHGGRAGKRPRVAQVNVDEIEEREKYYIDDTTILCS